MKKYELIIQELIDIGKSLSIEDQSGKSQEEKKEDHIYEELQNIRTEFEWIINFMVGYPILYIYIYNENRQNKN